MLGDGDAEEKWACLCRKISLEKILKCLKKTHVNIGGRYTGQTLVCWELDVGHFVLQPPNGRDCWKELFCLSQQTNAPIHRFTAVISAPGAALIPV